MAYGYQSPSDQYALNNQPMNTMQQQYQGILGLPGRTQVRPPMERGAMPPQVDNPYNRPPTSPWQPNPNVTPDQAQQYQARTGGLPAQSMFGQQVSGMAQQDPTQLGQLIASMRAGMPQGQQGRAQSILEQVRNQQGPGAGTQGPIGQIAGALGTQGSAPQQGIPANPALTQGMAQQGSGMTDPVFLEKMRRMFQ